MVTEIGRIPVLTGTHGTSVVEEVLSMVIIFVKIDEFIICKDSIRKFKAIFSWLD